jgi:hypothetical protein
MDGKITLLALCSPLKDVFQESRGPFCYYDATSLDTARPRLIRLFLSNRSLRAFD